LEGKVPPSFDVGKLMHCVVSDMIDYNRMLGKEFKLQLENIKIQELLEEI
jgi:hypothetical protein